MGRRLISDPDRSGFLMGRPAAIRIPDGRQAGRQQEGAPCGAPVGQALRPPGARPRCRPEVSYALRMTASGRSRWVAATASAAEAWGHTVGASRPPMWTSSGKVL